ncbi:MAG: bifunctional (p)ppGpp synthetase/guanosine-3',5'-bis(diphosphate) 3'-pyrophosphohydrolase [Gemmatimonadetes bacterium]|nr:bifunctional (p)ppGpp synthetase/guanosine-3',5'-bis(diphosphate) 3'-pyrophosphohydrolase [Gemmatimonadota bacterium]
MIDHRSSIIDSSSLEARISHSADLLRAIAFAADKHRDQRRKDAEASPYVNHVIAVAELLARVGEITDQTVLVAAILHDTVEDTETTAQELADHFGTAVARIVAEVTDDKSLLKEERKRLQIEHARDASPAAKLVKLGDKIVNVVDVTNQPPPTWSVERRLEYLAWAERVIAGCRGTNAALERMFDEVVVRGREKILQAEGAA